MLVERWHRIESLFHDALEKTADERASFLDGACSSDHAMRREIESLLQHENLARRVLESDEYRAPPATEPRDPVPAGERIGPYALWNCLEPAVWGRSTKRTTNAWTATSPSNSL